MGDEEIVWELKGITAHEEPLNVSHHNYKIVWCNVMVECYIGKTIIHHPSSITLDDPFTYDLYTNKNNMLLTLTSTLILRLIGVTFNYPLIKYGKDLIYVSFHE